MQGLSHQRSALSFLLVAACLLTPAYAQNIITTVAGSTWIFRGEGRATNAPLSFTPGVAADSSGNVFASDSENHLVVKISAGGALTVVAGNGIAGYSGDGGPATSASLNGPRGLAVDSAGNLYIADTLNFRIRRVGTDGKISTLAGNGGAGFFGDGGSATEASLNQPQGVAVDANGNLYIADYYNYRIRRVSPGGVITTVAGNGIEGFSGDGGPATAASLAGPSGIAVDAAGNLYVVDNANHRIRKFTSGGTITTVAGNGLPAFSGDGGPAVNASLTYPTAVAVDASGNLYIADWFNQRIRKVSSSGTITTMAGNGIQGFSGDGGPATDASLALPNGVAADASGNLYIADFGNSRVRKVTPGGTIGTIAGNGSYKFSGDGGLGSSASLRSPEGVAVDRSGNIFVADTGNHRVRKVTSGGTITTVAGRGVPGFSGDNGPATDAPLNAPRGLAVDSPGNLYIADTGNHRIRKITPGGTISTVAGSGLPGFLGDGGPAVNASLSEPRAVALDAAGNLYIADSLNNRIRKVSGGTITTVAGTGVPGFSGDNALATAASLSQPYGVAVDAANNLFIADLGNNRIRRVTSAGTITTVAGSGGAGYSGDGGPATLASFYGPRSVAVDATGSLYIADAVNNRIRKVSAGTITTVAGNGVGGFSGDGGPARNASLNGPFAVAVDGDGNLYIADAVNDRVRKVLVLAPPIAVSPSRLVFTAPAGAPVVGAQQIVISSPVTGLGWSAQVTLQSGANWLAISPAAGSAPGAIAVSVNVADLQPGTYRGIVSVQASPAGSPAQNVAIELTVQQAPVPQLVAEPASLTFESPLGEGNPPAKTLRISNAGTGSLAWTARADTSDGRSWLLLAPGSGSASATSPAGIQVFANVAGLAAGVYSGTVRVESGSQAQTVTVTLLLAQVTQSILLSQTGLLFTGVEAGGLVPSQNFGILNTGQGGMNWTVQPTMLSGTNWLSASPTGGRSEANSLEIPLADVPVDVGSLRAGQYSGFVRVNAPTANNSPQFVSVDLNVLPVGSNPGVLVRPTGLIFAAQPGGSSPGSQTVRLATAAPGAVGFVIGPLTFDGATWLEALPRGGTISHGNPAAITVQTTLGSLAPGIYRGTLTLQFSDDTPAQLVNILFVVVPAAAAGTSALAGGGNSVADCVPQRLVAVHRTLALNFSAPVGWPSPLEVQVANNCGQAVPNATVVASFSNADPAQALVGLRNGIYSGTWRPVNATAQPVTVTVRANLPPLTAAEIAVRGQVPNNPNPTAPALFSGGVVNAASFASGEPLAPGSIISVFGRNLARGSNATFVSPSVPLDTKLGGSSLNVGGVDVPLFFSSDGQINAQLPFDLAPNSRPQVVVRAGREGIAPEVITVPETITIAAARPAIFRTGDQQQGAIRDALGRLVDSAAPAAAGEFVVVFATGLGVTQPAVTPGQAAPNVEPLARVVTPVEARIGGKPATVHFAGLAPGFVGLYQVNLEIPAGVEPGNAVPVVLLQNGAPSNTVTMAVR